MGVQRKSERLARAVHPNGLRAIEVKRPLTTSSRHRLICAAMFLGDGAPIRFTVVIWALSFDIRASSLGSQPTEAVRVTVAETYFASCNANLRTSTVTL